VPTKKKHMGRNAKNAGRHHPASGPTDANKAMNEMKPQNNAGTQGPIAFFISLKVSLTTQYGEPDRHCVLGNHEASLSQKMNHVRIDGQPNNTFGLSLAAGVVNGNDELTQREWLFLLNSFHG
jgi:hypothetical protein